MYNRCTLVEFRGVWIASVYNIDWPKTLDNPEAQKQEFIEILDKLDSLNINAIFVQVRPTSDALYKSYINPAEGIADEFFWAYSMGEPRPVHIFTRSERSEERRVGK